MDDLTLSLTAAGTLVAPVLSASRHDTDPVRDRVSGGHDSLTHLAFTTEFAVAG
jgi:hypothetical protein